MTPDDQKKGKRGSAFPPTKTAKELLEEEELPSTEKLLANHQAPITPALATALDVAENGVYAALGFRPEICVVRRSRTIQLRPFESETHQLLVGGTVDPSMRLKELAPVVEADLDVQLDIWEKKKRGWVAWRQLKQEGP